MEIVEKTILLVCNSNMFVPYTLTEILKNPDKRYLVISDIESIKKFFDLIDLPNVDFYKYGYNPTIDGYFGFIRAKKNLLNFVKQYSLSRVVFFHAEFGEMVNWLIKELSRTTPVEYCKVYDSIPYPKAPLSKRMVVIALQQWIWWGLRMDMLVGSYPFPSLPKSFYRKVKAKQIILPIDVKLNGEYLKDKLTQYNISGKYVLLTGTAVHDNIYTEDKYTPFVNQLIEVIGDKELCSKCHPRFKELYGKENDLKQIPSFIPGNVLLDSFDYFIGYESTLLVEAAQAGKKAISLIDCLKPDEEVRIRQHDFFENRLQGRGKIFFPKSIDEVKTLLK